MMRPAEIVNIDLPQIMLMRNLTSYAFLATATTHDVDAGVVDVARSASVVVCVSACVCERVLGCACA
jgi:hypothetical protein